LGFREAEEDPLRTLSTHPLRTQVIAQQVLQVWDLTRHPGVMAAVVLAAVLTAGADATVSVSTSCIKKLYRLLKNEWLRMINQRPVERNAFWNDHLPAGFFDEYQITIGALRGARVSSLPEYDRFDATGCLRSVRDTITCRLRPSEDSPSLDIVTQIAMLQRSGKLGVLSAGGSPPGRANLWHVGGWVPNPATASFLLQPDVPISFREQTSDGALRVVSQSRLDEIRRGALPGQGGRTAWAVCNERGDPLVEVRRFRESYGNEQQPPNEVDGGIVTIRRRADHWDLITAGLGAPGSAILPRLMFHPTRDWARRFPTLDRWESYAGVELAIRLEFSRGARHNPYVWGVPPDMEHLKSAEVVQWAPLTGAGA